MGMYKAPTDRCETLQQALRRDLQNIPVPEPTLETAHRMAQVLREISQAMRAVDPDAEAPAFTPSRPNDQGTYWRRCS
jgi:hypothetical protein